ncbi:stage II sporulation protein P [Ruminococcus sp. YRD2003]|uniref:stage II sporulation protein P n=1 Tax=Ruminococcus sp. YRD2003 TaxID=1452313 RepID=UPI0008D39E39|nr:stage II sporulation protein P [Ruminococcus flavefaciens]
MTRYKRRKAASAIRLLLLLSLPLGAAVSAKALPAMKEAVVSVGSLHVGSSDSTVRTEQTTRSFSDSDAKADILRSSITLSEGYGLADEEDTLVKLISPRDMVSRNAGPKPYPSDTDYTEGGDIIRTTYGVYSGTSFFDLPNGGQVNNKTELANDTLIAESRCLPNFTVTDTDEPQILIYHTHTTESFEPYVRDKYDADFNYRTTDDTKNMVMVGNAIQAELEAAGYSVIHATDIHDYPSYNGSYGRSRETILPILEQYPSIKVALDIHRDAISGEGTAAQPYIGINGREAAQVMIISGCDDGTLDMPDYMKNFHFACCLQQQLESDYPGLTRPILFDYRHYNQDLTTGSLLIEVGSHCNTLEQAQYSGQLIGQSLSRLLDSVKEQ